VETATILVVCTGNIRRSPALEVLLRDGLPGVRGLAGSGCTVSSAGVRALAGEPLDARVAGALAARGVELPEHRATPLTADLVEDADLVLTAERAHRSAVVGLVPSAVHRTFTVRELAALGAQLGRDGLGLPDVVPSRVRALVEGAPSARATRVVRRPAEDDLADLRRNGPRAARRFVEELWRPVETLLGLLEPAAGVSSLAAGQTGTSGAVDRELRRSAG
jgi:protein-tyrosine phosphatase